MKTILFIHQSSEMYGSDKTLLILVSGLKQKGLRPIVVLPGDGPLVAKMAENNIEVILTPVIKISRKMFGLSNLLSLPSQVLSSIKKIDQITKDHKIDCIYSNTLAVLIGLIYARRKKLRHIWHIHEIVEKPSFIRLIFEKLIALNIHDKIIYNSFASKDFWEKAKGVRKKTGVVVWNGISKNTPDISDSEIQQIRKTAFGCGQNEICIALVGRINRWKGQQLLLEALREELISADRIRLIFVGSAPPNQDTYINRLTDRIEELNLSGKVKIIPFQSNIWPIWESIDIAVVPSTEPEPFGLVAIEAMLCHKPVIAAAHGGLTEIIAHNETGILFDANHVDQLKKALDELISSSAKRQIMGKNGFIRANTFFTLTRYVDEIEKHLS